MRTYPLNSVIYYVLLKLTKKWLTAICLSKTNSRDLALGVVTTLYNMSRDFGSSSFYDCSRIKWTGRWVDHNFIFCPQYVWCSQYTLLSYGKECTFECWNRDIWRNMVALCILCASKRWRVKSNIPPSCVTFKYCMCIGN